MLEETTLRAHAHRAIIILPHSREHFVHDESMDVAQCRTDLLGSIPSSAASPLRRATEEGLSATPGLNLPKTRLSGNG
jgi:hypothetical protein